MPVANGKHFVKLLSSRAKALQLSQSDLGVWFDRPRQTIRYWLVGGSVPRDGPTLHEYFRRLELLDRTPFLPVPHHVRTTERAEYLKRAFLSADNARLSKADPARRRAEKRNDHP